MIRMWYRSSITLFAFQIASFSSAFAAPIEGVYRADHSRVLLVMTSSASSFSFTLSIGIAGGQEACEEGSVDCLSVSGQANFKDGRYVYEDGDAPGDKISFVEQDGGIVITKSEGSLGAGSGNIQQLDHIVGSYALAASNAKLTAAENDTAYFQTPSGNIGCAIWLGKDSALRCDMKELQQTYTNRPADCDLDWGSAFELTASGKAEVSCHGDTAFNADAEKLEYGRTLDEGGFRCISEKTGLTCKNGAGHGFTLSKARQKFF